MGLKVITDWYSPDCKPMWNRPGLYLTHTASHLYLTHTASHRSIYAMHWNGFHWMTIDRILISSIQDRYWCGLAFDPGDCGINSNGMVILYNPTWESDESTKRS